LMAAPEKPPKKIGFQMRVWATTEREPILTGMVPLYSDLRTQ